LLGLIWLVTVTDLAVFAQRWAMLLFAAVLYYLLEDRLSFTVFLDPRRLQASASGAFGSTVLWSSALLFGSTALWIALPELILSSARSWRASADPASRLEIVRNGAQTLLRLTFGMLIGLAVYQALGGLIPFPGLALPDVARAFAGIATSFALTVLVFTPFLIYFARVANAAFGAESTTLILRGFASFLLINTFIELFGILAAGLYAELGVGLYLVGAFAVVMVSWLANRLSKALNLTAERNRALQQIGDLGRAILTAPADRSRLPQLLREHAVDLFLRSRFEARLFDGTVLVRRDDDWPTVPEDVWQKLRETRDQYVVLPGLRVDTDRAVRREALAVPIRDGESGTAIGGIYVLRNRAQGPVLDFLPTAQALAEQIASALLRVQAHEQAMAVQRAEQELEIAAEVQANLLPNTAPLAEGWTFSGHLQSARAASGDFFDFIGLGDQRLGLVIADVADKGMGAAMVMALSRTLIRTFAFEHPDRPDLALASANRRMCDDLRADTFVTAFFGVLDLRSGELAYCNAGHSRPLLIDRAECVRRLESSGMALGILPQIDLALRRATIAPGEALLAYTDGLTDTQNAEREFYGDARLIETVRPLAGQPAAAVRGAVTSALTAFSGGVDPFDDVTLVVVSRDCAS
jgi:serine phosphatase RsbU (regulator of sigma subunit)